MSDNKPTQPQQFSDEVMFFTPIQSIEHLQAWCLKFLGFTLPDCKVTEYADSTPAEFVYECYRAIMDGAPLNIIGLSGRDTAKTVSLSIIDLLALVHDQRDAIHIGMIKQQAQRAREYLEGYIGKSPIAKALVTKQNTRELKMKIGDEEFGLELISLDPKQVQGAHKSVVSYDELASSTDPIKLKAYKDSSGIPGSSRKGKPAVIIKITSRQTGDSIPEVEIKNAHKNKLKIRKWTTFDCMEKCPDERSGTTPAPMYIDIIKGKILTPAEFDKLTDDQKQSFKLAPEIMDKCHSCPLMMYCQGKARKQTSTSALLRDYDTVVNKVLTSGSHEWVLAQLMSLEPSKEGLVYFEYKKEVHVVGWNVMWERLTGEKATEQITRQKFVEKAKRMGCQFYAGVDWGWSSPSTCVALCVDNRDNIYVIDAIGRTFLQPAEFIKVIIEEIHTKYGIDLFMPDSEDQAAVKQMRTENLPVVDIDKSAGTVKAGISTVKRFLRVAGTNAQTKIFFSDEITSTVTNTPGLLDELEVYKKRTDVTGKILDDENPEKGNDHYLDALRYVIYWLFGKDTAKAVFADNSTQAVVAPVASPQMPMEQIAAIAGLQFNDNRGEFDKMGLQPTPTTPKKPDDDPDGTPGGAGGGGMQIAWT